MATREPPNAPRVIRDNQLQTLATLGRLCGERLVYGAKCCGEDPRVLVLKVVRHFLRTHKHLEDRCRREVGLRVRSWRRDHVNCAGAPALLTGQFESCAWTSVAEAFIQQTMDMFSTFLAGQGDPPPGSEPAGGEPLSADSLAAKTRGLLRLVLHTLHSQHPSRRRERVSRSVWRGFLKGIQAAKLRWQREQTLPQQRERTASLIARVFLARLLATYRIEPRYAICDFLTAMVEAVDHAVAP